MGRIQEQLSGTLNTAAQAAVATPIILEKAGNAARAKEMAKVMPDVESNYDRAILKGVTKEEKTYKDLMNSGNYTDGFGEMFAQADAAKKANRTYAGAVNKYNKVLSEIDAKYVKKYGIAPSFKAKATGMARKEAIDRFRGGKLYGNK